MGNCPNKIEANQSSVSYKNKFQKAVESENTIEIGKLFKILCKSTIGNINEEFMMLNNLSLNALSYALVSGKRESFRYLYEEVGCSVGMMEAYLSKQDSSGVVILCENNDLDFLRYYLPFYVSSQRAYSTRSSTGSLFSQNFTYNKLRKKTPASVACANGNTGILELFREQFDQYTLRPEFDCNAVDEHTKENCSFIACRNGDLHTIKYLYQVWNVDFHLLNKRMENCINVTVLACVSYEYQNYIDCVKYLVETIACDVSYRLAEIKSRAQNPFMKDFLSEYN